MRFQRQSLLSGWQPLLTTLDCGANEVEGTHCLVVMELAAVDCTMSQLLCFGQRLAVLTVRREELRDL
jgi:hypothetical protein